MLRFSVLLLLVLLFAPAPSRAASASLEIETEFGIPASRYRAIFADGLVTDGERRYLYQNYYQPLPAVLRASATLYGPDGSAMGELLQYGLWLRQQMDRGWVLIASGEYGYHDELYAELPAFIEANYRYKDPFDTLLSKQSSPVYFYFADRGRPGRPAPISVSYSQLNARQRRVFDLTSMSVPKMKRAFFVDVEVQSQMAPAAALASGKYIGVVSAKSVNDFGRRFLLFQYMGSREPLRFVGVVIVGGEAKRDDWTGLGSPTSETFSFKNFPLATRVAELDHWAFDLPASIYEFMGGDGGPVTGIIAIDPDMVYIYPLPETLYARW